MQTITECINTVHGFTKDMQHVSLICDKVTDTRNGVVVAYTVRCVRYLHKDDDAGKEIANATFSSAIDAVRFYSILRQKFLVHLTLE